MLRSALLALLVACGSPAITADDCTADEVFTTECSACGETDACIDPVSVCAATCEGDFTSCDNIGGLCMRGACVHNVCG